MSYIALPVLVVLGVFSPEIRLHGNSLSRDRQQQNNSHRIISLLKADTGSPRGRAEYPRISATSWLWLNYKRHGPVLMECGDMKLQPLHLQSARRVNEREERLGRGKEAQP